MKFDGYDKYIPVKEKLKEMEDLLDKIESNINNKRKFRDENK